MAVPPPIAAALLSWAAATDNRQITREAAIAWADALDSRVTLDDGKAAISAHRAASSDYLMPAHVNAEVRRIRRGRLDFMASPQPPQSLDGDPRRELAWRRAYVSSYAASGDAEGAMSDACASLGVPVPPVLVEAVRKPPELSRLIHQSECDCGCLTKPVRASEGDPR